MLHFSVLQSDVANASELVLDIGKPAFDDTLAGYLKRAVDVGSYIVVGRSCSTAHSFDVVMGSKMSSERHRSLLRHALSELDSAASQSADVEDVHSDIVDSVRQASTRDGREYFFFYYKVDEQRPFTRVERERLHLLSDLLSAIILLHYERDGRRQGSAQLCFEDLEQAIQALPATSKLTRRETQVCAYILQGCSSESISLRLGVSIHSVLTYRRRAYDRLGITSQGELFALVLRRLNVGAHAERP